MYAIEKRNLGNGKFIPGGFEAPESSYTGDSGAIKDGEG